MDRRRHAELDPHGYLDEPMGELGAFLHSETGSLSSEVFLGAQSQMDDGSSVGATTVPYAEDEDAEDPKWVGLNRPPADFDSELWDVTPSGWPFLPSAGQTQQRPAGYLPIAQAGEAQRSLAGSLQSQQAGEGPQRPAGAEG